jgi:chaperonin cofactor prefoldin
MNNLPTLLTITVPTFVVLIGILLNRHDYNRLNDKLDGSIERLNGKLDGSIERLNTKFDALQRQMHEDMMLIMGRLNDLDSRLSRVEERMAH